MKIKMGKTIIIYYVMIFCMMWTLAFAKKDLSANENLRGRRHTSVISIVKSTRRGRHSRYRPPIPKIVHHAPVNHLQHGPYYINHYIVCDGLDSSGLNLQKPLHFLDIPKSEFNHNLENNFSVELPEISSTSDHTFSSELGGHDLNKFYQQYHDTLARDEVIDLNNNGYGNGQVGSLLNHNLLNVNQGLEKEYNNGQNIFGGIIHTSDSIRNHDVIDTQGENKHLGDSKVPVYHQPLENDSGKASYNTPGAVDSYGAPIHSPNRHRSIQNPGYSTGFHGGDEAEHNNNNFLKEIANGYLETLREINGVQRSGRHVTNYSESVSEKSSSSASRKPETGTNELNIRHPNHKYD